MKRLLFDVNVVLDVLLDRKPHVEASSAIWAAVERGRSKGMLAAHGLTTIYYLIRRDVGSAKARGMLAALLNVFEIAPVDGRIIEEALRLSGPDFEDAVMAASARRAGCDYIVTRDPKGFRRSPVRAITPETAIPLVGAPQS